MFYYLNGKATHIENNLVVIDCNGVGYACSTSQYTLSTIKLNETVKLYTVFTVKQDGVVLAGFSSQEEKNLYQLLSSVSGVGSKAALSILSLASPSEIALAIITDDYKMLSRSKGIGKRISQRIILELKDTLSKEQNINFNTVQTGGFDDNRLLIPEDKVSEASAALAVLGYSQNEINTALKGIDMSSLTLEQIIKAALKNMLKN